MKPIYCRYKVERVILHRSYVEITANPEQAGQNSHSLARFPCVTFTLPPAVAEQVTPDTFIRVLLIPDSNQVPAAGRLGLTGWGFSDGEGQVWSEMKDGEHAEAHVGPEGVTVQIGTNLEGDMARAETLNRLSRALRKTSRVLRDQARSAARGHGEESMNLDAMMDEIRARMERAISGEEPHAESTVEDEGREDGEETADTDNDLQVPRARYAEAEQVAGAGSDDDPDEDQVSPGTPMRPAAPDGQTN